MSDPFHTVYRYLIQCHTRKSNLVLQKIYPFKKNTQNNLIDPSLSIPIKILLRMIYNRRCSKKNSRLLRFSYGEIKKKIASRRFFFFFTFIDKHHLLRLRPILRLSNVLQRFSESNLA